jgi:protein TonB
MKSIFITIFISLFFSFSVFAQTSIAINDTLQDVKIDTTQINTEEKYDNDIERIKEMMGTGEYDCILIVEQSAVFEGGMEHFLNLVNTQMRFSETMKEGRVFIQFVVNKTGKVSDIKVVKGLSEENDKEALRIMNLISEQYDWIPAKQRNTNVKVRMNIPILFKREKKVESNVERIYEK